jgi:hypothetical protein
MWQVVPFGGRWRDEITAAVASYRSISGDTLAAVIDLGEPAELGLPENSSLITGPTLQAHDGYHPNRERHAQLGAMIARAVQEIEGGGSPGPTDPIDYDDGVAGGRYLVNGVLVNSSGQPI